MRSALIITLHIALGLGLDIAAGQDSESEEERSEARSVPDRTSPPAIDIDAMEPAVDVSRRLRTNAAPEQSSDPPAARSRSVDRLDLGTTSITGNQELPKVLYIVPWKRSDIGDVIGRPVNTLLNEVLAPIDPVVFERQLGYYDTLYGQSEQE